MGRLRSFRQGDDANRGAVHNSEEPDEAAVASAGVREAEEDQHEERVEGQDQNRLGNF